MSDSVAKLVTIRPDSEIAAEIRAELKAPLDAVADIVGRARNAGLVVQFNIAPDNFGRIRVLDIAITRPL